MRVKRSVQTLPEKYQVCAVAFADAGDQVVYNCDPYAGDPKPCGRLHSL
jgi:hypothetical protein